MVKIPSWVVKNMSGDDAAVYIYLQYAHQRVQPVSIPRIAQALRIGQRRVRFAIRRLIDAGYLEYRFNGRCVEYTLLMPRGDRWMCRRQSLYSRIAFRNESHLRVPNEVVQGLLEGKLTPDGLKVVLLLELVSSSAFWSWHQLQLYLMWSRAKLGRVLSALASGGWIVREYGIRYLSWRKPPLLRRRDMPLSRALVPQAQPPRRDGAFSPTPVPQSQPLRPVLGESCPNRTVQYLELRHRGVPEALALDIVARGRWHEALKRLLRGDPPDMLQEIL